MRVLGAHKCSSPSFKYKQIFAFYDDLNSVNVSPNNKKKMHFYQSKWNFLELLEAENSTNKKEGQVGFGKFNTMS